MSYGKDCVMQFQFELLLNYLVVAQHLLVEGMKHQHLILCDTELGSSHEVPLRHVPLQGLLPLLNAPLWFRLTLHSELLPKLLVRQRSGVILEDRPVERFLPSLQKIHPHLRRA